MRKEKWYWKLYLLIFCTVLAPAFSVDPRIPSHGHETPKVTKDWCTKCDYKVDDGDEYVCCKDCSDTYFFSNDQRLGYCKSGAELLVEPKPKEIYKWVAGPWKACSSLCDGGIRYRDVDCYAVFEVTMVPDYPVYDYKCSKEEKPVREEPCNLRSCLQLTDEDLHKRKHNRTSTWMLGLISLGLVAIIGVGFACFIQYKRRTSMQYGQVYIMMDGYS
ncbi:ADAMTS-like protein 4 isoform X2 [Manihot esculenta]|uniref:Uncharacterized protein n=1 Tax=Manihot esculenta TaxID=3983 RepID=A0ACB7GUD4_MANES|nr:ADAMTS-like protein 4 isoform X2 [Manihot esculenta]KAG8643591.1 hypothetical protein MANES_11G048900v8 [Manihot esculenta]